MATLVAGTLVAAIPAHAALPLVPDDTWGADGRVLTILRVGGTIFLGGEFSALVPDDGPGVARGFLGALDASTGQPTAWDPELNEKVFNLAVSPDGRTLYVVGSFTKVGSATRKRIAAFDLSASESAPPLLGWKPSDWPNNVVRAIQPMGSTLYVGGGFGKVGSAVRPRLAAFDATSGALLPWAPAANKAVRAFAVAPGRLYAAGDFSTMNGAAEKRLTALNPSTGAVIPGVFHPGYPVLDLQVGGSRLFAAGAGAGGRALAVDLATGAYLWDKKSDGNIQGVGFQGGMAYFGGHFFKFDGRTVSQLVRVDPSNGAQDRSWLPSTNGFLGVFTVRGFGSTVYAGGDFDHVSQVKQLHFAQFTDGGLNVADLSVSLSAATDPVGVGGAEAFTAQVFNAGPDQATGVAVTDVVPAGATFDSASAGCFYATGSRTVTCLLGSISSGGTASATITLRPGSAGTFQNQVSVGADQGDPNTADNTASASVTVVAVSGADLELQGTSPSPVSMGTQFAYSLTLKNTGPDPATDVTLSDLLPSNVTFVSAAPSQGSCSGNSVLSCSLGSIGAGSQATLGITVKAPGAPMTLTNDAVADSSVFDPDIADNSTTIYTTVKNPANHGTVPPMVSGGSMFDDDANGKIDRVVVTFNKDLAACPAPCTFGWTLTNVPSDGHLLGVEITAAREATLWIAEGSNDPETDVGGFRFGLSTPNGIQDAAGNHATVAATAPADKAGPVPIAFRHGHNNKASIGCGAYPNVSGVAGPCDELTTEWSEPLKPSSIPATTTLTIQDPPGSGNDTIGAPGFFASAIDGGGDGYVTIDGAAASWAQTVLEPNGPGGSDYLTLRIWGPCTGGGCGALGTGPKITVTYIPPSTITDLSGNQAVGSFVKPQKIGLF